jgi:hypothetical protein
MRQVIGILDLLAEKDDDRIVWITAKSIRKRCKNYGKKVKGKQPTNYSLKMVEKCLQALRAKGILSRRHAIKLQERRLFMIEDAYVVTPHEALCEQHDEVCRFVGAMKVDGTMWGFGGGDMWFMSNKHNDKSIEPKLVFKAGPGMKEKP